MPVYSVRRVLVGSWSGQTCTLAAAYECGSILVLAINVDDAKMTVQRKITLRDEQKARPWVLIGDLLTGLNGEEPQQLIEVNLNTGAVQARSIRGLPAYVSMTHE